LNYLFEVVHTTSASDDKLLIDVNVRHSFIYGSKVLRTLTNQHYALEHWVLYLDLHDGWKMRTITGML